MAQVVHSAEEAKALTDNTILGIDEADWGPNVRITFAGTGNVLYLEKGVKLGTCAIRFPGDSALIVLRKSRHHYQLHLDAWSNTTIYLGKGCYYNGQLNAIASEGCQVVVGDGCLFSFDIWLRTADPHLVYDVATHRRINPSKNVFIGDHVWVGQDALILKGSTIGSGSIIGAKSVVAGKCIPSNESWAGNPARCLRTGIFWEESSVHNWGPEQTAQGETFDENSFIYATSERTVRIDELLAEIAAGATAQERLDIMQSSALWRRGKNRFYLAPALTESAPEPASRPGFRRLFGSRDS